MLNSPALHAFEKAVREGESLLVEELWESPKAFLANLAREKTGRSVVLITSGMQEDRIFEDLSHFAPESVIEFPSWEILPGEEILPSPDILGKRFEALRLLIQKKTPQILICSLASLLQKVLPKKFLAPLFLDLTKGCDAPFNEMPEILTNLGYKRVPIVSDKGEFAVRGGIIDLFPITSTDPYRIEFFDDTVEQIRTFDSVGQKTIQFVEQISISPATELPLLKQASCLCPVFEYFDNNPLFFLG